MLLKEIIEEADLLVNNALGIEQKIRFINSVQRNIYRDYPLPDVAYFFVAMPGVTLYELPPDCEPENIINVFVDDRQYTYSNANDTNRDNLFTFVNDELFIQPTPEHQVDAYLYYNAKPVDLTKEDLELNVPFLKDYHELFVLGCAEKLAMVEKDYKLAAELQGRFKMLANEALLKLGKLKLKKIRVVRGWV